MFNPNKKNQQSRKEKSQVDPELALRFAKKIESETSLGFLDKLFKELPELEFYLVGGMVRDTIIKHPTSKDYDFIARGVNWDELVHALQKFGRVDMAGRNYGVIKFNPENSTLREAIDIALPRVEFAEGTGGYHDIDAQADPNLTIAEDLSRRDLTINAMSWDVRQHEILDPFNGQADLKAGMIRCVGNPKARFQEDYSRMLRAMRFACRFDFKIEDQTWAALTKLMTKIDDVRNVKIMDVLQRKIALTKDQKKKDYLRAQLANQLAANPDETMAEYVVPRETVAKELFKTLKENPARALKLWDESGALKAFLPETLKMKNCEQPPEFHSEGDVWTHTKMMLEKINSKEFRELFKGVHVSGEFVLGVIGHDAGKPLTKKTPAEHGVNRIRFDGHDQASAKIMEDIANRLSLSKEQKEMLKFMASEHMVSMAAPNIYNLRANTFAKRFIDSPYSQELLMLFYLDSACSVRADGGDTLKNFRHTLNRIQEIKQIREKQPSKIIDGRKIMDVLQIKGGPLIGCVTLVFSELADSGRINSEAEAITLLERHKDLFKSYLDKITGSDREQIAQVIIDQIVKFLKTKKNLSQ